MPRVTCEHPSGNTWWEHDNHGIPLCKVCPECQKAQLGRFRSEVLSEEQLELLGRDEPEASYEDVVHEPIEPEDY